MLGLNVRLNAFGFSFHHAHELDTGFVELGFCALFKKRQHLLTRKLRVDREPPIREIDHRIHTTATIHRALHFKHVGG